MGWPQVCISAGRKVQMSFPLGPSAPVKGPFAFHPVRQGQRSRSAAKKSSSCCVMCVLV